MMTLPPPPMQGTNPPADVVPQDPLTTLPETPAYFLLNRRWRKARIQILQMNCKTKPVGLANV